jgi:hypothetical protein
LAVQFLRCWEARPLKGFVPGTLYLFQNESVQDYLEKSKGLSKNNPRRKSVI